MMVAVHSIVLSLFAWLVSRREQKSMLPFFWSGLIYKLLLSAALGLIYSYYYTANDTWLFFEDAQKLAGLGRMDFGSYVQFLWTSDENSSLWGELANTQVRSLFLVKIISLFSLASGDSYWISAAWFAFISFLSGWYVCSALEKSFPGSHRVALFAFIFFPSIAFWSSGLVKETLALSGIYFLTAAALTLLNKNILKWREWLLIVISFWVSWNLKYYWTAVFCVVLFTTLITFFLKVKTKWVAKWPVAGWMIVFIALCFAATQAHPNFYISRFLQVLVTNHDDFIRISDPDGVIHFYTLSTDWSSILLNTPLALLSGIFRPFVWETNGLLSLLASLENLFVLVLFVTALPQVWKQKNEMLLLSVLVYTGMLCVFLALSTPNLGTLSRYRIGFLPYLIFLITWRNPLLNYFSSRFKIFHR